MGTEASLIFHVCFFLAALPDSFYRQPGNNPCCYFRPVAEVTNAVQLFPGESCRQRSRSWGYCHANFILRASQRSMGLQTCSFGDINSHDLFRIDHCQCFELGSVVSGQIHRYQMADTLSTKSLHVTLHVYIRLYLAVFSFSLADIFQGWFHRLSDGFRACFHCHCVHHSRCYVSPGLQNASGTSRCLASCLERCSRKRCKSSQKQNGEKSHASVFIDSRSVSLLFRPCYRHDLRLEILRKLQLRVTTCFTRFADRLRVCEQCHESIRMRDKT